MLYSQDFNNTLDNYNSVFKAWHKQASIRNQERRIILENELEDKVFFPIELFPIVSHPLIKERGEEVVKKLLLYRLYIYLDFTECLELEIVNPVAYKIAHGRLNIDISRERKLDAYKIYVDEAYHALFSVDIKEQVEEITGIPPIKIGTPKFLQDVFRTQEGIDCNLREVIPVFWAIVSETLITSILMDVPKDRNVVIPIREMIHDHARDEKIHHIYFASLLETVWFQLKAEYKTIIGSLLPKIILAFLEPDVNAIRYCLESIGLEHREIDIVIEDSYPEEKVMLSIRNSAKLTLKHFGNIGIYEDKDTLKLFEQSGLLGN